MSLVTFLQIVAKTLQKKTPCESHSKEYFMIHEILIAQKL